MERGGDVRSARSSDPSLKVTRADAIKARSQSPREAPSRVMVAACRRHRGEVGGRAVRPLAVDPCLTRSRRTALRLGGRDPQAVL